MILTSDLFEKVELIIPIEPIYIANTRVSRRNANSAHQPTPPTVKDIAIKGMLPTTNIITLVTADKSLPLMIACGVITVVSSMSNVCFSFSDVMADAVSIGVIKATITSSVPPIIGKSATMLLYILV